MLFKYHSFYGDKYKSKKATKIISTCDERLFKLMHQKFEKDGDSKAIFHRFESIGDSGPVVCELTE